MGDNDEMGRLAVTEELHAKQQEAARKEAERAARKAPQDAAADAKGEAGEPASPCSCCAQETASARDYVLGRPSRCGTLSPTTWSARGV